MGYDVALFWIVCLSCASGVAVSAARFRATGLGWIFIYLAILLVAITGRFSSRKELIYASVALWILLVLLPALIAKLYHRSVIQQRYAAAAWSARIICCLHPADGWRQQPQILRALDLAQRGDLDSATRMLERFQGVKSTTGIAALINLYRLTGQWEELLAWAEQHRQEADRHPQLLPILLRAHGETGDQRAMVELYGRMKERIARLHPASSREFCRLALFAFCGQRERTEQLLEGGLSVVPAAVREFWLATAEFASGCAEAATARLQALQPTADPPLRHAIERRLSRPPEILQPLDEMSARVTDEAAREQSHDDRFAVGTSLFSKAARGTQLLIVLNLLMFLAEVLGGGSDNLETLFQLGALYAPAVRAGEWWRPATSLFLHFGPLHLAMNLFALWLLGPFVERALGFTRFMLVYSFAGLGSMGFVMTFATAHGDQLMVGASGSIMGLVGGTAAVMLRGWLRERAHAARRRMAQMVIIVAMQTAFDLVVPQVSMSAHLSGALFGFLVTMLLRDQLSGETRRTA